MNKTDYQMLALCIILFVGLIGGILFSTNVTHSNVTSPSTSARLNISSTGSGFSTYSGPEFEIDLGATYKDSLTIHKPWMCKDGHAVITETTRYVILSCRGKK